MREDDARAARAEAAEPDPPVDVLPQVDHLPVGGDPRHRRGHELLDPPDGRRRRVDQPVEAMVHDGDLVPALLVGVRCVPAGHGQAQVMALPRDEVRGDHVRRPAAPPGAGAPLLRAGEVLISRLDAVGEIRRTFVA